MYYGNDDPFGQLRQVISMQEDFLDACGNSPTYEQKEAIRKNLYNIGEIERTLRNARTPSAVTLADRCSSLQCRMRGYI